ncbi:prepilin peptidase [Amycolatopsis sp. NPDC049691]|uniref:prepilin peptidase n=1 Tax=Amycolatopsis sp. NPDC049691 TaxID=3155155 RepID=UPI00343ECDCD
MSPTILLPLAAAAAGAATAPVTAHVLARARAPIPRRLAAVLTALVTAAAAARWAAGACPAWWLPIPVVLGVVAVPLALADLRHLRLPDTVTLPAYPLIGAAIGAAALGGGGPSVALRAAMGAFLFGGAHALVARLAPGSLGAGDVKLSGSLGMVLGAAGRPHVALAAVLAAVFSLALALARAARSRAGARAAAVHPASSAPGPQAAPAPNPRPASTSRPAHIPRLTAPFGGPRVPHGPGLLAATWLCALFPAAP